MMLYDTSVYRNDAEGIGVSLSSGIDGQSVKFIGASDFAYISPISAYNFDSLTAMLWFKTDAIGNTCTILYREKEFGIDLLYNAKVRCWAWIDNTYYSVESEAVVKSGVWYHVVLIYDKSAKTLYGYLNGMQFGSITVSGNGILNRTYNGIYVGNDPSVSSGLNGFADELRLYNKAVGKYEIMECYRGLIAIDVSVQKSSEKMIEQMRLKMALIHDVNVRDEVEVWLKGNRIFGGYVTSYDRKLNHVEVVAMSYGLSLTNTTVNYKVFSNKKPEEIAKELVEYYTELKYVSNVDSGIVLSTFISGGNLLDVLYELMRTLGWTFKTDSYKNFYFEPENVRTSDYEVIVGGNAKLDGWVMNTSQLCNEVYVIGASKSVMSIEKFVGNGSNRVFTIAKIPIGLVRVEVDGVELEYGVDYDVDLASKTVTLVDPPASGKNVLITYEWNNTPIVKHFDPESQRVYGVHSKILTIAWADDYESVQKYAEGYLSLYAYPLLAGRIVVAGLEGSISDNEIIKVKDLVNNIEEYMVVKSVEWRYPDGVTILEVGSYIPLLYDWQQDAVQRVKSLEKRLGVFGTVALVFRVLGESMSLTDRIERVIGKMLKDTQVLVDSISIISSRSLMLSEVVNNVDTIAMQVSGRVDYAYTDSYYYTTS